MKRKSFKFALLGAIALMGSVGFSACSDDNETTDETGKGILDLTKDDGIPVNLVLNVSRGTSADTRMSAANTQALRTSPFRGIDNAHLFAYKADPGKIVTTPGNVDKYFDLGTLWRSGMASNPSEGYDPKNPTEGSSAGQSHRVVNLSLSSGTSSLLFYGKAIKDGTDVTQGKIAYNVNADDPANTTFEYVQRLAQDSVAYHQVESYFAAMLTGIVDTGIKEEPNNVDETRWFFWNGQAQTKVRDVTDVDKGTYVVHSYDGTIVPETEGRTATKTVDGFDYTLYHVSMTWKEYGMRFKNRGSTGIVALAPLEEILGEAYNALVTLGDVEHPTEGSAPAEFRAGSAEAIHTIMNDLYNIAATVVSSNPTNYKEYVAQLIATRIIERISTYYQVSTGGVVYNDFPTGKTLSDIVSTVKNYYQSHNEGTLELGQITRKEMILNFPQYFGIPAGGCLVLFEDTNQTDYLKEGHFYYRTKIPSYALNDAADSYVEVENYVYPAELMYFGNSPVHVTNNTVAEADYPEGATEWVYTGNAKWIGWTQNGTVTSDTKSVAMAHNINYGTALLETKVKFTADELKDNNAAIHQGEADHTVNKNFSLSGVLIATQPKKVGWDFTSKTAGLTAKDWNYLVYDNNIPNSHIPNGTQVGEASEPNYTLLLDNFYDADAQNDVYVALELVNNTDDFWGNYNLIRNGGTFYIIGKLDLTQATNANDVTFPESTSYIVPPYNTDGSSTAKPRIFMQDYKTSVTFTIGKNALKNAYLTVPNMSTSQISLGLSVDIAWQAGLNFDVVIGGN